MKTLFSEPNFAFSFHKKSMGKIINGFKMTQTTYFQWESSITDTVAKAYIKNIQFNNWCCFHVLQILNHTQQSPVDIRSNVGIFFLSVTFTKWQILLLINNYPQRQNEVDSLRLPSMSAWSFLWRNPSLTTEAFLSWGTSWKGLALDRSGASSPTSSSSNTELFNSSSSLQRTMEDYYVWDKTSDGDDKIKESMRENR